MAPNFQPSRVMADYEDGFIVSLKEVYGKNLHIEGCFNLLVSLFSGSCTKSEEKRIVHCPVLLEMTNTLKRVLDA